MRPDFANPETWPILVVDDEAVILTLTQRVLEELKVDGVPLRVDVCNSAAEAIELLGRHRYAVAIVDMVMETSSAGLELVESIHRSPRHRLTRIVVRTGDAAVAPELDLVERYGIADYWHKGGIGPARMKTLVTGLVRAYATARSLQVEQRYLGTLLDHLPNTVLHVRQSGRIDYCNRPEAESGALFRVGTDLAEYLSPESMESLRGPLRLAFRGEKTAAVEVQAGAVVFEARLGPSPGGTHGAVLILTELTERRAWEASLVTAGKLDVVARMAGGLAHQLNNSLTAVLTNLAMASESVVDDPSTSRHLALAMAASERMQALSQDLLHLTEEHAVAGDVVDLSAHLANSERGCRTLLGERIQFELEVSDELLGVRASNTHVNQILYKLLVHVGESMPQGGRVRVSADATAFTTPRQGEGGRELPAGQYVRLIVEDDGPGLSDEDRRHLFDPFRRLSAGDRPAELGLSVVYLGVRRLGGSVWVTSAIGKGTRIEVVLPRVSAADLPRLQHARRSLPVIPRSRPGVVVLLVEDDSQVRASVASVLRRSGYTVLEASDVGTACALLDVEVDQIDLLLSDIRLPDGLGFEVVRHGRGLRPALPVLLTSGYAGFAKNIREIGDVSFLRKPYLPAVLLAEVGKVLDDAASTTEVQAGSAS